MDYRDPRKAKDDTKEEPARHQRRIERQCKNPYKKKTFSLLTFLGGHKILNKTK